MTEPASTSRTISKLSHTGHGCRYLNSRTTRNAANTGEETYDAGGGRVIVSGGTSLLSLRSYDSGGKLGPVLATMDFGRGQPDVLRPLKSAALSYRHIVKNAFE